MLQFLSPRRVFAGLLLVCAAAMLFAIVFLQRHLGLEPCPLCMSQRIFMVGVGAVALVACLHNPMGVGRRIYAALCTLFALAGAAVAGRHVWLQHLPEDQVPACGPSLEYILDTLPFGEALELIMMGDGNCAETQWSFLGLSIPEQTLLLFIFISLLSLWQVCRRSGA